MLPSVTLGLFTVNIIEPLGLHLAVDESPDEASQELLGLGVAVRLACSPAVSQVRLSAR